VKARKYLDAPMPTSEEGHVWWVRATAAEAERDRLASELDDLAEVAAGANEREKRLEGLLDQAREAVEAFDDERTASIGPDAHPWDDPMEFAKAAIRLHRDLLAVLDNQPSGGEE
jgi:hypothetical protein